MCTIVPPDMASKLEDADTSLRLDEKKFYTPSESDVKPDDGLTLGHPATASGLNIGSPSETG
jgi:hypothetical protein